MSCIECVACILELCFFPTAEQVLTEEDVVALLNLIHNFSDKWHDIGVGLGFAPSELNQISCKQSLFMLAPASFLTELLSQWVQWPTVNHPIKPTLRAICEVLGSSFVGLGSLAEEVEREMKCFATGEESFAIHLQSILTSNVAVFYIICM